MPCRALPIPMRPAGLRIRVLAGLAVSLAAVPVAVRRLAFGL